jgi:phospholipid/cholesterol/gamma-HCH transport system substrate-binding protein
MSNRAYALAAAAFVLVLAGALTAAAVWLGAYRAPQLTYLVVAHTAVAGLAPQSQVLFRGVPAGSVDSIDFDPTNPNDILIRIELKPGLPIRTNTFATLRIQGVTGIAQLELDNGGGASQPLPTRLQQPARIPLQPSLLDRLAGTGEETLKRLSLLLGRFDQLVNPDAVKHVQGILAHTDRASRETVRLIADLQQTVRAVEPLAGHIQDSLGRIDHLADDADRLSASLRTLSTNVTELSESSRRATEMLATRTLPKADTALDQLTATADALRRLSLTLRANPQALLLGNARPRPGPGELGYDAAAQ